MKRLFLCLVFFLLNTTALWAACADSGKKLIEQKQIHEGLVELQKCADKKDPVSMILLGTIYTNGELGVPADPPKGFGYYNKASVLGNDMGQYLAGKAIWNGRGVTQNKKAGLALMAKAADQGNVEACFNVGFIHMNGQDGMPVNDYLALKYFGMADAAGNIDATNFIGLLVSQGRGIPKNEDLALKYFLKAAEKGHIAANASAGDIYVDRKDYSKAFPLYLKVAETGDAAAQHAIALFYWNGAGTQVDKYQALKWLNRCASQGSKDCIDTLTALGVKR